jgi:hypothetical protein
MDPGTLLGIVAAILGVAAVSAFAMRSARIDRQRRAELVARVDVMLRELAATGSGEYITGSNYHHPMIGEIPYPGSVRGPSWTVRLDEDYEDGIRLEILVLDIAVARLRSAPDAARALVDTLRTAKHHVSIDERPRRLVDPAAAADAGARCLRILSAPTLSAFEVGAVLRDALAIADACATCPAPP